MKKPREKHEIMRKSCEKFSIIGISFLIWFFSVVPLQAAKEIKVGYIPYDHMINVDAEGNVSGYGNIYLKELGEKTGWTYKFVEVKESERISKLISGEIDLLCALHRDCEEKDQLLFSEECVGIEFGMLATLKNNIEIFYEDFSHINGKKIGINVNSGLESALNNYAQESGFSYEAVYFEDLESMQDALNDTSIDIMLVSSQRDLENIKYVGKTYPMEEFFAVNQNNPALLEELNKADMELKRERPFYVPSLHDIFYGRPYQKLTGITREEYEFVASKKSIKVLYDANSDPVEYQDKKTGEYMGAYADALALISEESGLKFEYIPLEDYSKAWEMIKNGEADMIGGDYGDSILGEQYNMIYSESYFTAEYTVIGNRSREIPEDAVIAIPQKYLGIQRYFSKEEPTWKIVFYDDVQSCLEAVNSGEVDLTAVNTVFLQTTYNLNSYDKLRTISNMSKSVPMCIGIGDNDGQAQVLKGVLDKTIYQIPEEKFQDCITENTINIFYSPTMKETLINSIPIIMILLFSVLLIAAAFISKREKHYRYLALTDTITGLWNGVKFFKEAQEILDKNEDKTYVLMSVDINKFKFINNDFGVQAGDKILWSLGRRIQEVFGGVACYARSTADVFLIMIEKKNFREEMLNPLRKEIYFDNSGERQYYKIVLKFGIRIIQAGEKRVEINQYVDQTSMARKTIKESANVNVAYYDEKMKENIARDMVIENKMEAALENRQFHVYLQPKYDLQTEKIIGAEALVRWVEEGGKIIRPDMFIPLFERNGFIVKVDFYVYEQVMKRMAKWMEEGRKPICVSVNVSRVHMRTYDFFIKLNRLIEKYQIPKQYFELELTETILGGARSITRDFIKECKKEGYQVSIDDFGSGYSSLNLLKDLPVDILKIDKGFLDETEESRRSSIIVEQVVEMAKKMKIGTLCEGVETSKQAAFLKQIGCDMAQGYLFSRPIPMGEFEKMI